MRNRVVRALVAFGTVLACLLALPVPPANAVTQHRGDRVCNLYANSNGFGAYCSSGNGAGSSGGAPPTWAAILRSSGGRVFIPCRDFEVPAGIDLPAPDPGKKWALRLTIVDYDLNAVGGGPRAKLERAIVQLSPAEENQCPSRGYMDYFWQEFHEGYPSPGLIIKPTYTPRVNVPAYFTLTDETSQVFRRQGSVGAILAYNGDQFLTMRALVTKLEIDPGDGTPVFTCPMNVNNLGDDGYDETKDPFHQVSICKHTYKRSSANQPESMYTVKLTVYWQVSYWKAGTWSEIGTYPVHAVQRLPVQEVQTIGG